MLNFLRKKIFKLLFLLSVIFFFFSATESVSAFSCDSGSLETTCYVSTAQTMTNGETISGTGDLVIQSGGDLTASATHFFTINMGGDVTIETGGEITGNLTDIVATNLTIDGVINVNSKGHAGGGAGATGSGSGAGPGASTATYQATTGGGGAGYGGDGGTIASPSESPSSPHYYGDEVDLVASPAEGYVFSEWTGDISTVGDPNSASTFVVINDNYSITANFALE